MVAPRWSRLLTAAAVPAGAFLALAVYALLVPLESLEARAAPPGSVVLASDGSLLFVDRAEGLRIPLALDEIAPIAVAATIAAEDERFRLHPGVDPIAVARVVGQLPDQRSGASTITQQLARRLYLADQDTPLLLRKAREALIALQLETRYSKDELLEVYLNDIYYGRGAYGIEAAARTYFGVSARDLDLTQASFLAGLPQLPALYADPAATEDALARQRYVLGRLVQTGRIAQATAEVAAAVPLSFERFESPSLARHFTVAVFDELATVAPQLAGRDGIVIETTLDPHLQRQAEHAVAVRVALIADHDATNGAVVALEVGTGHILAMVGSVDFDAVPDGQNNLALARRQPGSTLKPLLYTSALEHGYTVATPLLDVPSTFKTAAGIYEPVNYDLSFRGPVPLRTALASSLNVPAVRTLDHLGVDLFLELAHRVGLCTLDASEVYGLALTLGGGEVRLLDLAAAYGVLADEGHATAPFAIARVRDAVTGELLYERPLSNARQVLAPEHAFLITDVLADPVARMPAFGVGSIIETSYAAAVKTGSSSLFRDSWTVGYTSEVVVAAWVGNPNGRPMTNLPGVEGAAPIWRDVIDAATRVRPHTGFPAPQTLVRSAVCAPTGLAPGPHCGLVTEEWFAAGTEPSVNEQYFVAAGPTIAERPVVDAQPWALDAGVATSGGGNQQTVTVVQPAAGSVLYLAPEFGESEALLRAAVPAGRRGTAGVGVPTCARRRPAARRGIRRNTCRRRAWWCGCWCDRRGPRVHDVNRPRSRGDGWDDDGRLAASQYLAFADAESSDQADRAATACGSECDGEVAPLGNRSASGDRLHRGTDRSASRPRVSNHGPPAPPGCGS